MDEADLLAEVPLFASLKPDRLAGLASKLAARSYRRGEVIFHKDDPGATLFVIKSGQVKITSTSPEGEDLILAILADGDFFGEFSLLDEGPRSASATAMEPTQAAVLHRGDFLEVISGDPESVSDVLAAVTERLRRTDLLLEDAVFLDLPGRLAKRLLELGEKRGVETDRGLEIDLRITQQEIANAVGASRVAVNKLLGAFQDKGLVQIDRQHITILRPEELRKRIY
jgi:CRP/FNR family transcriptional regulator/CRP/FNR family cyclic AMP-dependent transcriptional regulator